MITALKNNSLEDFEKDIQKIIETFTDEIEMAKKIISYIEELLKQMAAWLKKHVFESISSEIIFFKEIKPNILAKLILYKEILNLIASLPIDKNKKIKHLEKKQNAINQFYRKNREFIKYIKSKSTHNDKMYFSRKKNKNLFLNDCFVINQDTKLSTSHDYLLAEVIANELLAIFIENRIDEQKESCAINNVQFVSNLHWTAKKIDLVELIYGLDEAKVFDNGQADLKEIISVFEKAFQVDLGDNITRSYFDIKNRKIEQTRFLSLIQKALENKIDKDSL